MLVDEGVSLTAVVDWEYMSALPLWYACRYPAFLDGRDRATKAAPDADGRKETME